MGTDWKSAIGFIMKKINKLVFLLFITLFSCGEKNSLELKFLEPLNKLDFKIEMEALGSDTPKALIYDGNKEYEISNEYGENEWYFNYKDSIYAHFRHIKTNRNDIHKYNYNFIKRNGKIQVEINIDGVSRINSVVDFATKKI
jgi:hypothetical protein